MAVSALGYLGFHVSDPEKWKKFGENVIGFEVLEQTDDTIYLRMERYGIDRQRVPKTLKRAPSTA